MRAIGIRHPGGPEVLHSMSVADPSPRRGEVLISVAAAGINRADLHQREGNYPSPDGAPKWPGLEVSGTILDCGPAVKSARPGDRVCALLSGGGYAQLAIAQTDHTLPVPANVDLIDAAALPEAVATVWSNIFMTARLRAGQTLLVHGGSGGIGTMAIQLGRAFGCRVAVTASTEDKLAACERLGADILINYRERDFVEALLSTTEGRGADVILDAIGGGYLDRNLRCLAPHGQLVIIGNQSKLPGELSIGRLMSKWGTIHGSTLRARSDSEKSEIVASLRENVWPLIESGQIVPVVDERFPLDQAEAAHRRLESGTHFGKLLLTP